MSIKVAYFHNYLDRFIGNLGDFSEEQGIDYTITLKLWKNDIRERRDNCSTVKSLLGYRPGKLYVRNL